MAKLITRNFLLKSTMWKSSIKRDHDFNVLTIDLISRNFFIVTISFNNTFPHLKENKFQDFPATQILREINIWDSRSSEN